MHYTFRRTAELSEAKAFLVQALESGKFPHALLLHGPEGAGQNALLLDIADILLCESGAERPCGKCPPCLAGARGNSERLHYLHPLEKGGTDPERRELDAAETEELVARSAAFAGDPYGAALGEKDLIRIVQIRDLQGRLAYAAGAKQSRIVLLPWAESLQAGAANALLKTLEEPFPGTHFLLSCSNRKAVLPTILSRCTALSVPALDPATFAAAAASRKAWWDGGEPPRRLLPFAEGCLGALLALHRNGGDALLEEAGFFLDASLSGGWRSFSDYLDGSAFFDDLEGSARLLHFVLRMARCHHGLRMRAGGAGLGEGWLISALERQGWDPSLASLLGRLDALSPAAEHGSHPFASYVAFLESTLSSIQDYSKPRIAALGNWLEFESSTLAKAEASPEAARSRGIKA